MINLTRTDVITISGFHCIKRYHWWKCIISPALFFQWYIIIWSNSPMHLVARNSIIIPDLLCCHLYKHFIVSYLSIWALASDHQGLTGQRSLGPDHWSILVPTDHMSNSHEASLAFTKIITVNNICNNNNHRKQNIRFKTESYLQQCFKVKALTRYNFYYSIWQLYKCFQKTKAVITLIQYFIYCICWNTQIKIFKDQALSSTKQFTFCKKNIMQNKALWYIFSISCTHCRKHLLMLFLQWWRYKKSKGVTGTIIIFEDFKCFTEHL